MARFTQASPALHLDDQDVDITVGHVVHRLLVQHAGQRRDLVAQLGRLLELQPVSAWAIMRDSSACHHRPRIALQKAFGIGNILGIFVGRDVCPRKARTALDLVQADRVGCGC
jgi:hypothetical protein